MWKYVPKKLLKWKKERGSCIQWCRYKFQQILLGPSQFKRIAKTSWTNSENTNTTHKNAKSIIRDTDVHTNKGNISWAKSEWSQVNEGHIDSFS